MKHSGIDLLTYKTLTDASDNCKYDSRVDSKGHGLNKVQFGYNCTCVLSYCVSEVNKKVPFCKAFTGG